MRQAEIDITRRVIDTLRARGGRLMTLWMGQDAVDHGFQGDDGRIWDDTIARLQTVCGHDPGIDIATEYKPNEPRAVALMPDFGTTPLALKGAGRANPGVTLDVCHVLFADEIPAHDAAPVARHSRLMGVHLHDGYCSARQRCMSPPHPPPAPA